MENTTTFFNKRNFIIVGSFALILGIVSSVLAYNLSEQKNTLLQFKNQMEEEKTVIKEELSELKNNIDTLEFNNERLQNELELSRLEVDSLYATIDQAELKIEHLRIYRYKLTKLKDEKNRLLEANDSLTQLTIAMRDTLEKRENQIKEYFEVRKMLFNQNLALKAKANKKEEFLLLNSSAVPLRVRKGGKVQVTDRVKRAEKFKVCTAVIPNSNSINENKTVYFKIFNPNKELIGEMIKVKVKGVYQTYSAKHQFFYQDKNLDICKVIDISPELLIPGEYTLQVFYDGQLRDLSEFTLR